MQKAWTSFYSKTKHEMTLLFILGNNLQISPYDIS